MYLKKISLFNYKNFAEANFDFDTKINCFVGKNGIGKTNVLDAIYHLSNTLVTEKPEKNNKTHSGMIAAFDNFSQS